ncbi:Membrane protein TerC, possibly involved in tellurium resistance [Propionispira arboris]|uniref:Membrane protein TerC, possibly involved in tellurium resistance n=1 Tax=Propionispira arboris TaxID=84035 RepID=A0A1H7D2G2_9FIRM|nr:TerC family protein [Propionispira arboris]SEJ93672.1 Membrane protein TerC, possibly involved in tellurium resistance [Propionispira arboris]
MEWLTDPQAWIALVTLTTLEIVLGIDNVIFISIQASKLPYHLQTKARRVGLGLAMFIRIALLFSFTWLMGLTIPLFTVVGNEISGRDLILIIGGLFLIWKSTMEIHEKLEGEEMAAPNRVGATFKSVIFQILLLDVVFSLDSIITALGMAQQLGIMIAAVIIAVVFMMVFSEKISIFVEQHPTIKMLALSFLLLIGVALIGDGLDMHIPKGYIYFAMGFSIMIEILNMKIRKSNPVKLHQPHLEISNDKIKSDSTSSTDS